MIGHLDELESARRASGHIAASWTSLMGEVTVTCGANRIRVEPGRWATPAHVEGAGEEIFFVLGGSGLSWQDGACYEIGPSDCLVHRAGREAHTLRAGEDGLDVLAFGHRDPVGSAYLPRAGVSWLGPSWTRSGGREDHPWRREADAGEPEVGEPQPRPANVVALAELEAGPSGRTKAPGRAAGAVRSGLNWARLEPGEEGAPAHCHSTEEEIFVVLAGGGTLELIPSPARAEVGAAHEEHGLRSGSVVARPPGTGIAHLFRAGTGGLTYLAYGTRDPSDVCYYPRSNKVYLRGVGLIARLEPLGYFDGEPD